MFTLMSGGLGWVGGGGESVSMATVWSPAVTAKKTGAISKETT